MEGVYFDTDTRAIADLVEISPEHYLITRINVPRELRGRGLASELLQEIIEDADEEGVTLEIHPVSSGSLTRSDLVLWYKRHGFRWGESGISQEPVKVLIRRPSKVQEIFEEEVNV